MFYASYGIAYGSGVPSQGPPQSTHITAKARTSGAFHSYFKSTTTHIHGLNFGVTAYRTSRPSFQAAGRWPGREQEGSSFSNTDSTDKIIHRSHSPDGSPGLTAPVEHDPHLSDIDARLSERLVLLAADNAACLTSLQLQDIVGAIHRASVDNDRNLYLPPVAVERLIRELRRRRQLAAISDLPENLIQGPCARPLKLHAPQVFFLHRTSAAAATPAAAATTNAGGTGTGGVKAVAPGHQTTASTIAAVQLSRHIEDAGADEPKARSQRRVQKTATTGTAPASDAAASISPLAGSGAPASLSQTSGIHLAGADTTHLSTAQAALQSGISTDALLRGGLLGPTANDILHPRYRQMDQPQGRQQPPAPTVRSSQPADAEVEAAPRGVRFVGPQGTGAAGLPLPLSPPLAAAERFEAATRAGGKILQPHGIRRRPRRVHQHQPELYGTEESLSIAAEEGRSAVLGAREEAKSEQHDVAPRVQLQLGGKQREESQDDDDEEEEERERQRLRDTELRRFFEQLQKTGPVLPPMEALEALETCAVVGMLPPRSTLEGLLRSVCRAVAASAAGNASGLRAATVTPSAPHSPSFPSTSPVLPPVCIVAVLYGLTNLGHRFSQQLWVEMLLYLQPHLSYTGLSLWGHARLPFGCTATAAAAERQWQMMTLTLYDLVDLATAMADAGCNPSTEFLGFHAAAFMGCSRRLTGRQAARLLWSYATLDFRPPAAVQGALASTLRARAAELQPSELMQGLQALVLFAAAATAGCSAGATATVAETAPHNQAVWAAGVSSNSAVSEVGGLKSPPEVGDGASGYGGRGLESLLRNAIAVCSRHYQFMSAAAPGTSEKHEDSFLSWLMVASEAAALAAERPHGGTDVMGMLPPIPEPLSTERLAVVSRLLLLILSGKANLTAADEIWARSFLRLIAPLAAHLRPADLVPVVQLVCRLYGTFSSLLKDPEVPSISCTMAVPPVPSPSAEGNGMALQALLVAASERLEYLSYGQVVALHGSVVALSMESTIREELSHKPSGGAAEGATADTGALWRPASSPDAMLLARAAVGGRNEAVCSESGYHSAEAEMTAGMAAMFGYRKVILDPARWLLSLLREPSWGSASVMEEAAMAETVAVESEQQVAASAAAAASAATVAVGRVPALAATCLTGAKSPSSAEADSSNAITASDFRATATATEVVAAGRQMKLDLAARATTATQHTHKDDDITASRMTVFSRPPPSSLSVNLGLQPLTLLNSPRRWLQGTATSASSGASAASVPTTPPPILSPTLGSIAALPHSDARRSAAGITTRPSAAFAAGNAMSACVDDTLRALTRLLRSYSETRAPLPVQQLHAVKAVWRRHLHQQSDIWSQSSDDVERSGGPEATVAVADAREVADLMLAVAVAAPRGSSVRSTALLELVTVLGAGGEGSLGQLSPPQLTGCLQVVIQAAIEASSADATKGSGRSGVRTGRQEEEERVIALVMSLEPLLDEVQRRMDLACTSTTTTLAAPRAALPPLYVAAVCHALSHMSYGPIWPARLRRREVAVVATARAQLARTSPGATSIHLRRAIASYMPPLVSSAVASAPSVVAAPPPSAVRYSVWALRHLGVTVKPLWLERLVVAAPRYLRRLHPRATVDWLVACATRNHAPPSHTMRKAWLHLTHTWRRLSWQELYEVVWSAVRLGLRPPRKLMAAACESVAAAAARVLNTCGADDGSSGGAKEVTGAASTSAAAQAAASRAGRERTSDGGAPRRAVDPGGDGGQVTQRTASIAVRLLWAVQYDERYTPSPHVTAALCRLLAAAWHELPTDEQSAALWALARLPPHSGSERAVLKSPLGDAVVRHLSSDSGAEDLQEAGTHTDASSSLASNSSNSGAANSGLSLTGVVASAADVARMIWALARLQQPLPPAVARQMCLRLAAEAAEAAMATGDSTLTAAAPSDGHLAEFRVAPDGSGSEETSFCSSLRPTELIQALYGATRFLFDPSPDSSCAASRDDAAALEPLIRAVLATEPAILDARSLADALGTLSRFRHVLLSDSLHQTQQPGVGSVPALEWPRQARADPSVVEWSSDSWITMALARAAELFEHSVKRGVGDRPIPAWAVLEVLQAATLLGAPVQPRWGAAAGELLRLHLPAISPSQLADVLCCAAAEPSLPTALAWEALHQLVRVEVQLAAAAPHATTSVTDGGSWPSLQPDELARATLAAAQAVSRSIADIPEQPRPPMSPLRTFPAERVDGVTAEQARRAVAEMEVALPPPQKRRRLLAVAVTALACRSNDPRVAAMSPDELSILAKGVVASGSAPGSAWFCWLCGLMQRRMAEASRHGILRMCGALEMAEVWPGPAWEQACREQSTKLLKTRRMSRTAERQLHMMLLRLRAAGGAAATTSKSALSKALPYPLAYTLSGTVQSSEPALQAVSTVQALLRNTGLNYTIQQSEVRAALPSTSQQSAILAAHDPRMSQSVCLAEIAEGTLAGSHRSTGSLDGGVEGAAVAITSAPLRPPIQLRELLAAEVRRAFGLMSQLGLTFSAATQLALRGSNDDTASLSRRRDVAAGQMMHGNGQQKQGGVARRAGNDQAALGAVAGARLKTSVAAPDAFTQLLLVQRLTESRMQHVLGLGLRVASLQSAYALHVLQGKQQQKLQEQGRPVEVGSELEARERGRSAGVGSVGCRLGSADSGDYDAGELSVAALVRAQASESNAFGGSWGLQASGRGVTQMGLEARQPTRMSGGGRMELWVAAESLMPMAAYLREHEMELSLRHVDGSVQGEARHGLERKGERERRSDRRGSGLGKWLGSGAGTAHNGEAGGQGDLLACLVHVKYCGLLHTFSRM